MSPSQPEPANRFSTIPNPFLRDVVGSPLDDARADVPWINVQAKRSSVALVERVIANKESAALLLYGEPGSGKTHLLSRLRLHLDNENAAGRFNVFVSLRMQTSPSMLWRFVRGNLTAALLRRDDLGTSALERLLLDRRADLESMHHRDLAIVLQNLLNGVHVRDSAAWLRGYELPEAALLALGLSTQPVDEEFQEERAYQVIAEISRLTEPAPLVFCLDQVEALQRHVNDQEGIFALGKLVSALHDTLHNSAIVCCVQTSFIDQIKAAVRGSEQDRLLSNRAGLAPLTWEQACELISVRVALQPELALLRPAQPAPMWPLDLEKMKSVLQPGGTSTARKVLHRAAQLYTELADCPIPQPETLNTVLGRLYDERCRPHSAEEFDMIVRDGLPQLFQAFGMQPRDLGAAFPGSFDLVVEYEGKPVVFAVCNQRAGLGLVNRFRKLGEKWDPFATSRLVLLRDARQGIGSAAKASHQRLIELRNRQAELLNISSEALSALDAIRSLLADADSGDLSHNGEPVPRKTVEQWITSNLPVPLAELMENLKGQSTPAPSTILTALTALVSERRVVSIEEAARELRVEIKEVIDCASQNPQQFAALGGSGAVLFQPVRGHPAS